MRAKPHRTRAKPRFYTKGFATISTGLHLVVPRLRAEMLPVIFSATPRFSAAITASLYLWHYFCHYNDPTEILRANSVTMLAAIIIMIPPEWRRCHYQKICL